MRAGNLGGWQCEVEQSKSTACSGSVASGSGCLLMHFSLSVQVGLLAFSLGVALELAGFALERRDRP
jgi:hypothetical protein